MPKLTVQNIEEIEEEVDEITLTEEDKQFILNNPTVFADIWSGTSEAILLKHWPFIMLAQVSKAKRGDTASAKFITDFISTLATQSSGTVVESQEWEQEAIKLRDKLGAEVSALEMVDTILAKLNKLTPAALHKLLT